MATIILMMGMIKGASAIAAFDCSKPKFGQKYSLLEVEECPEANPTNIKIESEKEIHVYQEEDFIYTEAKECKVSYIEFVWRCGSMVNQVVKPTFTPETITISPAECESAFITKELTVHKHIKLSAKIGARVKKRVGIAGWKTAAGYCKGDSYEIWGQVHNKIVVDREYIVELRKFRATFDSATKKMATHPFCTADETSCDTGESTIIYKVENEGCHLSLLKSSKFKIIRGSIFTSAPSSKRVDQKRKISVLQHKDTPTIYMTLDNKETMKFIEKEETTKCGSLVIVTNYKGMYLSFTIIKKYKK